jgi:hypothetical protein
VFRPIQHAWLGSGDPAGVSDALSGLKRPWWIAGRSPPGTPRARTRRHRRAHPPRGPAGTTA